MGRKKQVKTIDWLIKNYMDFFKQFKMNEENIRRYHAEWKLKYSERIEDFLWHIFNHLLQENASQSKDIEGFYKRSFEIYSNMYHFRRVIEGSKAHEMLELLNQTKVQLNYEQTSLVLDVSVVGAPDCEAFEEIKGEKFPILDVIKKGVIPYDKCTRETGCVCGYIFYPKTDSNGSLIRKQ